MLFIENIENITHFIIVSYFRNFWNLHLRRMTLFLKWGSSYFTVLIFFRQCAAVIMKLAIKNWCFISFRGWSWTWCQFFNIIHNRFHLLQRKKSNGHAILLSPTPCLPIHLFRNSVCTEFLARIHVRHVIFLVNRVV